MLTPELTELFRQSCAALAEKQGLSLETMTETGIAALRLSVGKHASDKPEERQMNGIQFYKFGEALKAKELGYKLTEIIVSTESEISRKYQNQDAVAVPSATTLDGKTEYGIFKK